MKTPKSVKKAMRALGMKKGDKVEKVVAENKTMLKKENEAINKYNNKVYENKKNELTKVANIVKKYENMLLKNEKNKGKGNGGDTKVKKMARNYNAKMAKA
jgi:bifunctional DNA-binding transcriptional regulator/antitoxin component of YhaV-PrlF toxin-antitoxin module